MWCRDFQFADLGGDEGPELVGVFRQILYLPSCVRTFSRSGEVLGTYFNWGFLVDVLAADVDGDGKDEIVAAGTNNAPEYQGVTFILLDSGHLSGASVDEFVRSEGFRDDAPVRVVLPQWPEEVRGINGAHRLHAMNLRLNRGGSRGARDPHRGADRSSGALPYHPRRPGRGSARPAGGAIRSGAAGQHSD